MELSHNKNFGKFFIKTGVYLFTSTFFFGLLAGLQYLIPGIGRDLFSFEKLRPLHVSSAVFWILMTATGAVLTYLSDGKVQSSLQKRMMKGQYFLFTFSFIAILISYCFGIFGGREYWEFNPWFSIPIVLAWILFIIQIFSYVKTIKQQPVYSWMWFTGGLFFLFTYLESNLWLLPGFRNNLIKDMTIQWKSYGSMVGSWNMLVYGASFYLMDKISGNTKYSYSKIGFLLYCLSLFNLMFNWGHHVYTLPTAPYVKHIAYIVSMTELLIFGRILMNWNKSLDEARKFLHIQSYRFLFAADFWVFFNLGFAILMSIPALNVYMHGTHVIVGHTMGTTIGINSMLLLAFAYDILNPESVKSVSFNRYLKKITWITNIALAVFLLALFISGFLKAYWIFNEPDIPYGTIMFRLRYWFYVFFAAGSVLAIGLFLLLLPLMKVKLKKSRLSFFKDSQETRNF
ncbi:MAG TPA: cbb3-type cytochrome c oxidase subunit I [Edaphocola sp.]|nr:cbb3-type cytochrome c oxidase subunit I [Edaphocola sp.]